MKKKIITIIIFAILIFISTGIIVSCLLSLIPDSQVRASFSERFYQNVKTFLLFDYQYTKNENMLITKIIWARSQHSLILISGVILFTFFIGVPLGIAGALNKNNPVIKLLTGFIYFVSSLPVLIWALILLLFFSKFFNKLLIYNALHDSSIGWKALIYLLPAIALSIGDGMLSQIIRIVNEETLKILEQDFIRAVKARQVNIKKHVIRSLIIPVSTVFANNISYLIAGTIVVEYIFNWRGLGYQILSAVSTPGSKDYPLILAITMLFTGFTVLLNTMNEFIALATDPRLRDR